MKTVQELMAQGIKFDLPFCPKDINRYLRKIDYRGPGWYSLNDKGYYEAGTFPTYSRIRGL